MSGSLMLRTIVFRRGTAKTTRWSIYSSSSSLLNQIFILFPSLLNLILISIVTRTQISFIILNYIQVSRDRILPRKYCNSVFICFFEPFFSCYKRLNSVTSELVPHINFLLDIPFHFITWLHMIGIQTIGFNHSFYNIIFLWVNHVLKSIWELYSLISSIHVWRWLT